MGTRRFHLTSDWQQIGQGPLMVEAETDQAALVHFANVAPTALDAPAHHVARGNSITYEGSGFCYARAAQHPKANLIATGDLL